MKRLLTLSLIASTMTIGCSASWQPAPLPAPLPKITQAVYSQVKPGMTLTEVETVVGIKGKEVSSSTTELAGQTTTVQTYLWSNTDGTNMSLSFINGKLSSKAHFGLK